MSKSTISLFELQRRLGNEDEARKFFEGVRWGEKPECPRCQSHEVSPRVKRKGYRCKICRHDFTVKTGTIFEDSKIPLSKWIFAMYQLVTARKGISSMQLAKEIGVTQKTAWFMLHRLRHACANGDNEVKLKGIVEVDETYVGGKESNKHESKKLKEGRGPVGKQPIFAMLERNGQVRVVAVKDTTKETLQSQIGQTVEPGSTIYSDDFSSYNGLDPFVYQHDVVQHSKGEYVKGNVHTNSLESLWALIKRGHKGVYHKMSKKHLHLYVNEFAFRLNEGNVRNHTIIRLHELVGKSIDKRLDYDTLTGKWLNPPVET